MKHCWHRTGEFFAVNPPIYIVFCCWCAATGKEHTIELEQSRCHGKELPDPQLIHPEVKILVTLGEIEITPTSHRKWIDLCKSKGYELPECCVGGHDPPCIECPSCSDLIRHYDLDEICGGKECVLAQSMKKSQSR